MRSPPLVLLGATLLLAYASGSLAQGLFGAARAPCPKPRGLKAAATTPTSVSLTWLPGNNTAPLGCAGYLITVLKEGQPASSAKSFGSSMPAAVIGGLSPTATYFVQVRALSRAGSAISDPAQLAGVATTVGAGKAGIAVGETVDGAPAGTAGWACVAAEGYPLCSAGAAGLCAPISCADMARLGRCAAPYIREQDWQARTVTQHCAAECGGCIGRAAPRLADSMAPPQEYCCAFGTGAYFAGPGGAAVADL